LPDPFSNSFHRCVHPAEGRGHLAIKAGGAVYVMRCSPVQVIPRTYIHFIPSTLLGRLAGPNPSCREQYECNAIIRLNNGKSRAYSMY
jgi:hypothetical protein